MTLDARCWRKTKPKLSIRRCLDRRYEADSRPRRVQLLANRVRCADRRQAASREISLKVDVGG